MGKSATERKQTYAVIGEPYCVNFCEEANKRRMNQNKLYCCKNKDPRNSKKKALLIIAHEKQNGSLILEKTY